MGCGSSSESQANDPVKVEVKKTEDAPAAEVKKDEAKADTPAAPTAGGPSDNLKKFTETFSPYCPRANAEERLDAWKLADPNNNGYASLAEIDAFVQSSLLSKYPKEGEQIFKAFRPSYIRAFNDAKDAAQEKRITKDLSTEDYVERKEFRLCCNYLIIYAKMYDCFALIDGGGAGVSKDDDRKLSPDEWQKGFDKVGGYEFAAFKDMKDHDSAFKAIDANGSGYVMLKEFCRHIEKAEQAAGTEMGKLLAIGDDED